MQIFIKNDNAKAPEKSGALIDYLYYVCYLIGPAF